MPRQYTPAAMEHIAQLEAENARLREQNESQRGLIDRLNHGSALLSATIASAPEAIVVADREGRIVQTNPVADRLYARPVPYGQEHATHAQLEICYPDGHPVPTQDLPLTRAALDGAVTQDMDLAIRRPDGQLRRLLVNAAPIRDAAGRLDGAVGVFQDITDRKQSDGTRLRRQQAVLEAINRVFQEAIAGETEERLAEICLEVALDLTGSEHGLIDEIGDDGLSYDLAISGMGWARCEIGDNRLGHRTLPGGFPRRGLCGRVLKDGASLIANEPAAHPDSIGVPEGHPPLTAFLGVPLRYAGKTIGIVAVGNRPGGYGPEQQEDLEALAPAVVEALSRKRAEEALRESQDRYRAVMENSRDAVIVADPTGEGCILAVNPSPAELLGWTEEEMVGLTRADILEVTDPRFDEALKERDRSGEMRAELIYRRKDGTTFVGEVSSGLFTRSDGGTASIAVVRDVTERKRAEEALRWSERQLRELNETLEERVATRTAQLRALAAELAIAEERERRRLADLLHDDLQQTLAAVMFHLDLAREQIPGEEAAGWLKEPMAMLREAIQTSRSLSAELSPNLLHDTRLEAVLQNLAHRMEEQHGLCVRVEAIEPEEMPSIQQDVKLLLYRCVRELLFNTAKHAGVEEATIQMNRSALSHVEVTVADGGQGFDPTQVTNRNPTGGLGLLTIGERLAYIGGEVRIDSAPGLGARITLIVPTYPMVMPYGARLGAPGDAAGEGQPAAEAMEEGLDPEGRIRILLADDHAIVRQGLRRFLEDQPDLLVVGEAADGREAVQLARALHPDVVLMDLAMPHMDGVEATRRIAKELPDIRIIVLSMYDDPEKQDIMREAGARAYIPKGGPPRALLSAIRAAGHGD